MLNNPDQFENCISLIRNIFSLQIIFAIQVALRICQGNRLSGSLGGVKNTPTLSHLFFTRSQISSYLNHTVSGFRLILATALMLALTFSVKAQTSSLIFATAGANPFTVPAGVTNITVECWGGGGAGGQASTSSNGKGGGGGGAYASSNLVVTPGNTYTVTVGAGGIARTTSGSTSGGQSSFGTLVIALGGTNGVNATNSGTGGAGGLASGSTGMTTRSGGIGGNGRPTPADGGGGGGGSSATAIVNGVNGGIYVGGTGGAGGNGGNGDGGNGGSYTDSGLDGTSPGGGGGGRGDYGPDSGNGGSGQVIVTWTIPAGYCNGYASTLESQFGTGVVNANSSLGPPDNAFATLFDHNGGFVVQLDNLLTSGETIDVLWRRNGITLANPQVRVDFSIDGANWTNGTFSYTEPSLTWVTKNILLPINTRYIRFWETNEYNIDIDAISYYTPGVSTPTAISISAGTEPTCQLTNGTTTTTYATSATNNTGFNWSLSNALAGSINSTTGVMTWANGFSGSVDIQVTASGCNGPSPQVIHPVTVNPLPTITGSLSVCGVGSTTQLTASGTAAALTPWASVQTAIATVSNSGLVIGVAEGTSVITYTDIKGCGTTATVTVSPTPTTNMVPICQGGNGGSLTSLTTCPVGATIPSGPKDAGSSTSAPGPGSNTWQNAGNIISPVGGTYATADLTNASPTDYLQGTNYNLSIPADATIKGITVSINRQSTPIGIKDEELKLIKNGTILVTNKANSTDWPTSMEVVTYGGPSDLWGTTWTVAEINDLNFGVSLAVKNQNAAIRTASVDYMQISVTYTLPSTLDWFTVSSGGTKIGSGSPFDPVGVSGSGLTDTNTPSTTTYYAACSTSPGCRTATDFVITPSLPASVSIAAVPSETICAGTSVTFTATPTKGGATPAYQWKVNGTDSGTNSETYTSTTLADNDVISVEMTSNATCATGSPATSNGVTIAIPLPVGPIIFNMGATSTRYQVAGKVTYTATAINNTGITYSLDAASLLGGNNIDASKGEVTYSATWYGTSNITAIASGCNGPTTATHKVVTMKTTIGKMWCFGLFTATGALTNTGASKIKGDVGTNVGALTGFPPGELLDGGLPHEKDALTAQAAIDVVTAYNDLAATPTGEIISGTSLGAVWPGQILTPNVYYLDGALNIANDLILDGQGDPNALFIFKVNGALTTLTGSKITLINGAEFRNVYFQVYGAVVINAEFAGTLVAKGAITINTGSKLSGRALSVVGAIVINNSELNSPCSTMIGLPDNSKPNLSTPDPFEFCVENIQTLVYDAALTDFIPSARPDYYTIKAGDLNLDLNLATFVHGTCLPENDLILHWSIRNSADEPIKSVSDVFLTDITGQVSDYTKAIATKTDIVFQGAVNADVTYKITYWLEDTCGNLSDPRVTTITIKPRPNIIKED